MNQNDRIRNLKEQNYKTDPVNIPPWVNPFLRLSDNEVLNKLLNKPATVGSSASAQFAPSSEFISSSTQPAGLVPTGTQAAGLVPTGTEPAGDTGLDPVEPTLARPGAGRPATHPDVTTPHNGTPMVPDPDPPAAENPQDGDMEEDLTEEIGDTDTAPATTPSTTLIPNSAYGAGNTIDQRLNTMTSHYDGHTAWSLAGSNDNPNTAAVATHPPIVPATRFVNHVGVSNSLISSLYDGLSASQRAKLTTQSRSATLLNSSTNPALQTLLPSNFRGGKQIQSYRIGSNGNVYAYAYGTGDHPIYIGNWRESYSVTNPPFNQPNNPNRGVP
jgi:hypothetical protein